MSRVCGQCGKGPTSGHNVSYSQRKTKRRFIPNLFVKRIWHAASKAFKKMKICSRCLRTMTKKM